MKAGDGGIPGNTPWSGYGKSLSSRRSVYIDICIDDLINMSQVGFGSNRRCGTGIGQNVECTAGMTDIFDTENGIEQGAVLTVEWFFVELDGGQAGDFKLNHVRLADGIYLFNFGERIVQPAA